MKRSMNNKYKVEQQTPAPLVGRAGEGTNQRHRFAKAFSLIELMISLIVVSCITAAFTPVITKKLKSGSLIAGSVGDAFRNSKMGLEDCKEYTGIDNCMFCDIKKKECKVCAGSACDNSHQYTISKYCTCGECSSLFPDCQKCTEQKCEQCINGKLQQGSECVDCPDGKICNGTSNTPSDPPSGYYAKDGIPYLCSQAIPNCKQCSATVSGTGTSAATTVTCDTCAKNTYLKSDKKSCVSCSNTQYCPEGTNQSGVKTCSQLTTSCETCNADGCTKCSGTLKLSSGKCVTCDNGYTCDGTSTQTQCTTTGYYCTGGQSYACTAKSGNTNCIDCNKSTGVCTQCTLGTHKLTASNTCTTCDTGYWCSNGVSKDNTSCTTGCASCSNASACKTCSSGYYLNGTTCNTCPAGYWCSGGNKYSCDNGTWSNGGTGCTVKSTCCTATQPQGKWCTNGSCTTCVANCSTCSNATTCTSCAKVSNTQYFLQSNACYACPSAGASSCTGTGLTCSSDYEKDGTTCKLKCQVANCDASSCSNKTTCTKCTSSYWLNNNTCKTCPTSATCNGTSTFTCPSNKYNTGTACIDKPTSCGQANSAWSSWTMYTYNGHAVCAKNVRDYGAYMIACGCMIRNNYSACNGELYTCPSQDYIWHWVGWRTMPSQCNATKDNINCMCGGHQAYAIKIY